MSDKDRIRWVSAMPDSYVAGVFHWLNQHRMRYKLVDDGRTIWLASGDEVRDGDWIVAQGKGLVVVADEGGEGTWK